MTQHGCYKQKIAVPVIFKRVNAKQPNPDFDRYLYKLHPLVESLFARLKHFRRSPLDMKSQLAILRPCFTWRAPSFTAKSIEDTP